MRAFVVWMAVILCGLAVGVASGSYMALAGKAPVRTVSGWDYSPLAGARVADPYTRVAVARTGLFALSSAETLYLTRTRDDQGRPLDEDCDYKVEGGDIPARWWSLTLYAQDNFLAVNGDHAASFDATRRAALGGGNWTVVVSARPVAGAAWISDRNADRFSLTLRLYNPTGEAGDHPESLILPRVTRLACREGAN